MAQTWVRGRLVTPAGIVEDGLVVVSGTGVEYVGPETSPVRPEGEVVEAPPGGYVLPGLVDVHNHGGGGASFAVGSGDGNATAAREHLGHGTTSVVASVVTDTPEAMAAAVTAAARSADEGTVAGIHVEGPFLAPGRCGAQDPRHLRAPDVELTHELLEAGAGRVRAMTIAPELPRAADVVQLLLEHGVVPAVGHTDADAGLVRRTLADACAALGRPGLVTHLFNAMSPLHHRRPGAAAGALAAAAAGDARVELVADGVHLDDETVRMVFDLLGPDRVVLVTDAMAAAGMPDGSYELGPRRVRVSEGVARLADGEGAAIAGGTAHLLDIVRRCVDAGVGLPEAVTAATTSPADALGLEAGRLAPGGRADLVVVDADVRPARVMRAGRWV